MGDSDGFRLDDLSGLKDVSLSGIADGNILVYSAASGTWQNRATLPATAGVDSISNSDGTLTISPTTGAVVASINLLNANVWGAQQTFNSGATFGAGLTVSAGVITLDTVPQVSQNGSTTNTGYGTGALSVNTGAYNTASGYQALYANTTGNSNTASGYQALYANTTGGYNTASGLQTLFSNTTGGYNTASGYQSLFSNTAGGSNVASGYQALYNYNNTAGASTYLVGVGFRSGYNYTGTELRNIVIGHNQGVAGESDMLRIGNPASGAGYGQIAFSMLGLVGNGTPAIYGAGINVVLQTTTTVVTEYTPTTLVGQRYLVTWSASCSLAGTPTIQLNYTDPNGGAQTVTLFNSAMTAGQVANGVLAIVANNSSVIEISGLSAAGDIFVSADIIQTQR
jgi:hypothetical protein